MLKAVLDAIVAPLDHAWLNDVDGLETASNENLAAWIGARLVPSTRKDLVSVEVWRDTCGFGARWRP
jgi:6-pyruvoyltetrahydropterin/6-carboxytetrahydropterin synthase